MAREMESNCLNEATKQSKELDRNRKNTEGK